MSIIKIFDDLNAEKLFHYFDIYYVKAAQNYTLCHVQKFVSKD